MYDRSGQRKYLNSEERRAFLRAVERETDLSKKSFCLTLFYAGCRISEALNLTWDRVDFSEKTIIIETLKQRKQGVFRVIPLPSEIFEDLKLHSQDSNVIWPFSRTTGWRIISDKMRSAGISGAKACPKGLRHSFAVSYISNRVPVTTVQRWLGHKRLETTAIYLNTMGEEERELASKIW